MAIYSKCVTSETGYRVTAFLCSNGEPIDDAALQSIVIPEGTIINDYDGNVYVTIAGKEYYIYSDGPSSLRYEGFTVNSINQPSVGNY